MASALYTTPSKLNDEDLVRFYEEAKLNEWSFSVDYANRRSYIDWRYRRYALEKEALSRAIDIDTSDYDPIKRKKV